MTELSKELCKAMTVLKKDSQRKLIEKLHNNGQDHLFGERFVKAPPAVRRQLAEQLEALDEDYADGGIEGYIKNAKDLLEKSRKGVNPLDGWVPSVPEGQSFEIGTPEWEDMEEVGLGELGSVGFVLVAGGLGERLGYSSIKVGLPTELATETCYLQFYIEYIIACQKKYAPSDKMLPLCIMTSNDTNEQTLALLKNNNYFGMEKEQIYIVQQGQGVPAITNNDGKLSLDSETLTISTKPHGHGDIHALLHTNGVVKKWLEDGIKWLTLFQDTNGLAFHTLPLMLGVSVKNGFIMNSLTVPRKAKQAIGAICKLKNKKTGKYKTINVEYNQLEPVLKANGYKDGDTNDPETGISPFPGNINQLLFKLIDYDEALESTKGLMPEFVNPKYKDAEKTEFKKPTRLECMMQDFPTVLEGKKAKMVGFTSVDAALCFSPCKNATSEGAKLEGEGTATGTAASAEADQYGSVRKIMKSIGVNMTDGDPVTYKGITIVPGPKIVLKPDFVLSPADYRKRFPKPYQINISPSSTLIVRGAGVVIESLKLDGALVIDVDDSKELIIQDKVVMNKGWHFVRDEASKSEVIKMRGYSLNRKDAEWIEVKAQESSCAIM